MAQSIEEALTAAYEKHETPADEETAVQDVAEAGGEDNEPAPDASADTTPTSESAEETGAETGEEPQPDSETKEPEPAEPAAFEGESAPESRADAEVNLAPAAWRGAAKQHWGELPAEVQEEVLRRERETNQVLNDTAQARQFTDRFMEVAAPYQGIFQSERVDPLTAAQSLFQTAAELRQGSAEQKAGIIHRLMRQHGVDEQLLDRMLVGEVATPPTGGAPDTPLDPAVQAMINQQLQPIRDLASQLQSNQAAQSEALVAEMDAEIDQFSADPKNVFFADVMPVMAELFEAADRAGRPLSLEQAYKTAVNMDPQLSELQAKRDAALQANSSQSASARRQRAAASLKPTAVPDNTPSAPIDREAQLNAAWDLHSGR